MPTPPSGAAKRHREGLKDTPGPKDRAAAHYHKGGVFAPFAFQSQRCEVDARVVLVPVVEPCSLG